MKSMHAMSFLLGAATAAAMLLLVGAAPNESSKAIQEYQVIDSSNAAGLSERVQRAIKDGWRIQGDVAASRSSDGGKTFAQALVR